MTNLHKDIYVAKDFSRYPSGRYRTDSRFSGERFREDFLLPAMRSSQNVEVHLDGTLGYGSSFLDEAFGGMSRSNEFTPGIVRGKLKLTSRDRILVDEIWSYIK